MCRELSFVEYQALRYQNIRNADGFLIVYSITSRTSFQEVGEFIEQIIRVKDCDKVPMVIVENKCDLENERSVRRNSVHMYLTNELLGVPHFETSAKNGIGIDECFAELVRVIRKSRNQPEDKKKAIESKKSCNIL